MRERAALALVIFGHVGYIEAAGELAISPADMAALLPGCRGYVDDDHLVRADPWARSRFRVPDSPAAALGCREERATDGTRAIG